ncbi:MAG: hypothetical protein UX38_C0009G0016 [Microgenomates group bacterium GW2011_GWC1_46_16]|nr:MAG: hypothetical protein UX32_C0009G0020 [Microgenomates group bacterium GW2011_GWF1_46_12]KKU26117.1 MAG: hypothetical protein UX38_C0009G0016 [Microgenomates group bacterium GW2011_GWC1_46_16]KKU28129.1 MAG: hypothetical protein UX40_C0003G0076 [Microgenomates group bacterium GW2011_GWF2_46_18]KKU42806.1 MAG: hypothetical protein UX59_C0039G0003 [Microgenomates group bacterium GW2011_GWA1_46_7]KKU60349.1 MAG: hypothetical protein UX82_C0014G0008 [Microgenomates group bacterium GW2011_GWE1
MQNKIARLSYNQLLLLAYFLQGGEKILTVRQMEAGTPLKKKVLGGVLSSLSRTRFRGISLIEPMGKAQDKVGLRWKLNTQILDLIKTKKEVARLLASY